MIEARGLTKRFGARAAVEGLDLAVAGRGVVGLLGPNGAGKSTALRLLAATLPASGGSAKVAGFDVAAEPLEVRARVGWVAERPALWAQLTVREILRYAARLHGLAGADGRRRRDEVVERTGLGGHERRLAGELSRGLAQRVGLARALVHDPPVLLLDEPTAGLDPAQGRAVRELIRDLGRDHAVLLSTHRLEEAERLCERVVVLHRGRVVADEGPGDLAARTGRGRWVEVAVVEPPDDVVARLEALSGVHTVASLGRRGDVVRFRVEGGDAGAIAAEAQRREWTLDTLRRHRPTLEEAYLALLEDEA